MAKPTMGSAPKAAEVKVETNVNGNGTQPQPEAQPEVAEEFVSENLTKLRAQESDLEDKMLAAGKTPEGKKIRLQLWEVGNSIENEIASLKKAKIAAEVEAKQKKVVADFWAMFDLYEDFKASENAFEALSLEARDQEDNAEIKARYNDLNTKLKNITEPIINRLLGSVPKVSTGGTTGGTTGGSKGKIGEEIKAIIAPLYATLTPAQIRAKVIKELGYNDGTANAAIHQYECENSLNGKTPADLKK